MKNTLFTLGLALTAMPLFMTAGIVTYYSDNQMALKAKEIIALSKKENSSVEQVHYNGIDEYSYNCPETKCTHRIQIDTNKNIVTIGEGSSLDITKDFPSSGSLAAGFAVLYRSTEDRELMNAGQVITKVDDNVVTKMWAAGKQQKVWRSLVMDLATYNAVVSALEQVKQVDEPFYLDKPKLAQEPRESKEDTPDICMFIGKTDSSIAPTVSQTKAKGIGCFIEQNSVTKVPSLGKIPFLGVIKRSSYHTGIDLATRPDSFSKFLPGKMLTRKEAYTILRSEPNADIKVPVSIMSTYAVNIESKRD